MCYILKDLEIRFHKKPKQTKINTKILLFYYVLHQEISTYNFHQLLLYL